MSPFSEIEEGYVVTLNIKGSFTKITCYFLKYEQNITLNNNTTGNYLRVLFNADKVKILLDEGQREEANQNVAIVVDSELLIDPSKDCKLRCFYVGQTTMPNWPGTFYEVLLNAEKVHLVSSMKIVASMNF